MINTDKMREKYVQIIARRGAKPEGFGDIVELCDALDEMSAMVEDCKTKLRELVGAAEDFADEPCRETREELNVALKAAKEG